MDGISLSDLDQNLEKGLFLGLRAATVDAHLKENEPAAHIVSAYNEFLDNLNHLTSLVGGYAASGKDAHGKPVCITWELQYMGTLGIDLTTSQLTQEMWDALCKRTPTGCNDRCREHDHVYDMFSPTETRRYTNKSYNVPIFVKLVRTVYTIRPDITDRGVWKEVDNFLLKNSSKIKDGRGRWLCTLFKEMQHPMVKLMIKNQNASGKQCASVIRVPRIVGSKGCILSKKRRHGETVIDPEADEPIKKITPAYTTQDYAELREDPNDTGGYLILDGLEYVIRQANRGLPNSMMTKVTKDRTQTTMLVRKSSLDPLDVETCYVTTGYYVEKKCMPIPKRKLSQRFLDLIGNSVESTSKFTKFKLMWFGGSWMRLSIPAAVVLYAMGITSDRDVSALLGVEHAMNVSADSDVYAITKDTIDVSKYVCFKYCQNEGMTERERLINGAAITMAKAFRKTKPEREQVTRNPIEFFESRVMPKFMSHIPGANALSAKCRVLKASVYSQMCVKTVRCMAGLSDPDDIDHIGNQRLYGVTEYMSHLYLVSTRQVMAGMVDRCKKQLEAHKFDISNLTLLNYPNHGWRFGTAFSRIKYCLKTGRIKHNEHEFTGVTALVNRITQFAAKASVQAISSTVDAKSKATKVRQVHSTHWGSICPSDTPEGDHCGLTKHKALSAVTTKSLSLQKYAELRDVIFDLNQGEKTFMTFDRKVAQSWGRMLEDEVMNKATQRLVTFVLERFYPIIVDGMIWGYTKDPYDVCVRIKEWRAQDFGRMMVSSVFRQGQQVLLVRTQSGRLMRPLFNVMADQGSRRDFVIPVSKRVLHALHGSRLERSRVKMHDLYRDGTITFADVMEQESMLIGMDPTQMGDNPREFLERVCVTHFEIDPSLIFGIRASRLPYPSHNQSPRLTYYIQMKSQAVGWPMLNKMDLTQTTTYELCYPQRSMTLTRTSVYAGCYDAPDTQMAFVLVAALDGYNQEDACILNKSALDFGFGRTHVYKRFRFSESRATQYMKPNAPPLGTCLGDVVFCNPLEYDLDIDPKDAAIFQKMDAYGQLAKGDRVMFNNRGQPLIGAYKVVGEWVEEVQDNGIPNRKLELSKELYAKYYKGDPRGTIAQIRMQQDELGLKHVEIVVVSTRIPTIGDKMSQPFQKNSCGMLYRREDIAVALGPEGINGMTPDAIVNPHAFPSRMTLSPLIEVAAGYHALREGKAMNATAFRDHGTDASKENSIFDDNFKMGLTSTATCGFMNPHTGEPYKETYKGNVMYKQFTFGMMDFHRLKHMVLDKIQCAARATKDLLTRQPVQGKRRGGAVRHGEMERDCLIAHGTAVGLKDALYYRSDPYRVHICTKCGTMGYFKKDERIGVCDNCPSGTYDIVQADMPYASKLLFQELHSMGISARFSTT